MSYKKKINLKNDWFQAYMLPGNVIAIHEPYHFQRVISYLIIGKTKALLWDTGMGIYNIKEAVQEIIDIPVIVINSHSHFDHMGSNYLFDEIYAYDNKDGIEKLKKGWTNEEIEIYMGKETFSYHKPLLIDLEIFEIKGSNHIIPVKEGHIFDLGGRKVEVIHTPGHSGDSIMLACHEEKILFTGDTVYPEELYAQIYTDDDTSCNLEQYLETMEMLAERYTEYTLYCSHAESVMEGQELIKVAGAFRQLIEGKGEYTITEEGCKRYDFDGVYILV